jgi:hypothetical protein
VAPKTRSVFQLRRDPVHTDHPSRPRECGRLHGIEADAAAAEDGDRVTGADARGVDDSTEARDDGAAEQRGPVERDVVGDLQQRPPPARLWCDANVETPA